MKMARANWKEEASNNSNSSKGNTARTEQLLQAQDVLQCRTRCHKFAAVVLN